MGKALFDTLEYVKLLREVNFEQHQAEGLSKAQIMVAQSLLTHTATQNDLLILQAALKEDIRSEINKLQKEMHQLFIHILIANFTILGLGLGGMSFLA